MHGLRLQRGFNLLELTIVVGVLALLTSAATGTYEAFQQSRSYSEASARLGESRQAIMAFVIRNKRLPCPDSSPKGDSGRENGGVAGCPLGLNVGWLPYESLGLTLPEQRARIRYAVHRSSTADLVIPAGRGAEFADKDGSSKLLATLASAMRAPATTGQPYYKLPPANTPYPSETPANPEVACNGVGETINPAFALIAPGMDMDQAGGAAAGFDTMNNAIATQPASSLCMAPPERPASFRNDDQTSAESATSLLGWLTSLER